MKRKEERRVLQFGCLMVETNGVWRPTYERLYPKEMLREEGDEKEPEGDIVTREHVRFALTGEVAAVYGKISATEVRARMARTRMVDAEAIPVYEESQGYFNDFRTVWNARKNMFCLLGNERDEVFDDISLYVLEPDERVHAEIKTTAGRVYTFKATLQIRDGRREYGPETEVYGTDLTEEQVREAFQRIAKDNEALYEYGTKTYVYPSEPRGTRTKNIPDTLMLKDKEGFAYCEGGQDKSFFINGNPEEQETLCNKILESLNSST